MTIERRTPRYAHCDGHTDVCYTLDGDKLVTCGSDGDIRIWANFDDDDPVQTCVGEWALCVRHKDNRLYVATDNNNIQIMTFPQAERNGILSRFTAPVNHIAVGKEHNLIALVADDMEVKVVEVNAEGVTTNTYTFTTLEGPPLGVALSGEGQFLAVSAGDGFLHVWRVDTQEKLTKFECVDKVNSFMNAKVLCRVDFNQEKYLAFPVRNAINIVDCNNWEKKFTLTCNDVDVAYSLVQFSPCGKFLAAATLEGDIVVWNILLQRAVEVSKNAHKTSICSMAWNPTGNNELAFCDVQGQLGLVVFAETHVAEAADVTDSDSVDKETDIDFTGFELDGDNDDDDDDNAISLEKIKNETMGINQAESSKASSRASTPRPRTPQVPLQPPFMPSSTPEHLNPRYLCWNDVGVVRSYGISGDADANQQKSIEVEFHDATLHNSMMMQNYQEYTMAGVSGTALVVANATQIAVIPLSAGSKEWNLNTSDDEEIVAIAASSRLVCFSTSNYLVRVCSVFGTQKAVLSVGGPVVAMAAFECMLLVAYHYAPARTQDQCIRMLLVKLEGFGVESKEMAAALRPETTLFWLGFTDIGTPAMMDSSGLLSLFPTVANVWLPVCDTTKNRKSVSDGFFVTAVFESYETVRGIRCKGSYYPSFAPRPTLMELPLEPPFVELTTEKSQLEAKLFTWSTLSVNDVDKKLKETALKTFALACKNNLDQRALELIEMIGNSQLISLATKYATKLERRRLAEKLVALAEKLQQEETNSDHQDRAVVYEENPKQLPPSLPHVLMKKRKINGSETKVDVHEASGSANATFIDTTIDSIDTSICADEPKNPFLKSAKKTKTDLNPLSLTDKYAGYIEEKTEKENTNKLNLSGSIEKRKQPDSDAEKPKGKQRKLERFMFTKRGN